MLTKDRPDNALIAYKACRTESGPRNDEEAVESEFALLRAQVVEEMRDRVPTKEFFTRPPLRKRCAIGFLTMIAAQCTGSVVINSEFECYGLRAAQRNVCQSRNLLTWAIDYGPFLYRKLGYDVVAQLLIQCGWITVALANAINAMLIDRLGRVNMLGKSSTVLLKRGVT